ncbi:GSCOCG00009240001-RA-CDS [Cotesia congregata]|nr:GSCOCG00009240001-RA-CDS [Cotesia congregata]
MNPQLNQYSRQKVPKTSTVLLRITKKKMLLFLQLQMQLAL